jgi:hypothetical protein
MQRTPNKKQGVRLFKPVFFARYSGRRMPVIDSSDGSKTPFSVNSALIKRQELAAQIQPAFLK